MANISFEKSGSVKVELSVDEIEVIKKAYNVLFGIANELCREDGMDETETFGNTSTACDCIRSFLRDDCGVEFSR